MPLRELRPSTHAVPGTALAVSTHARVRVATEARPLPRQRTAVSTHARVRVATGCSRPRSHTTTVSTHARVRVATLAARRGARRPKFQPTHACELRRGPAGGLGFNPRTRASCDPRGASPCRARLLLAAGANLPVGRGRLRRFHGSPPRMSHSRYRLRGARTGRGGACPLGVRARRGAGSPVGTPLASGRLAPRSPVDLRSLTYPGNLRP